MVSRGSSYNWTSQGVIAMERGAFGDGVPSRTLAHEVAHLWWGQLVSASGEGERFLTESLAEHSSWRWTDDTRGAAAAAEAARNARSRWLTAVHEVGLDASLARTTFSTKAYDALAYSKGPLVLRWIERAMGKDAFDRALAGYAKAGAPTLEAFRAALRAEGLREEPPCLAGDGHVHLELEGVAFDRERGALKGAVTARTCPSGVPSQAPPSVTIEIRGRKSADRFEVAPGTFERRCESEPVSVALDPDAVLPAAVGETCVLAATRCIRSEPADGASGVAYGRAKLVMTFDHALAPLDDAARERIRRATRDASVDVKASRFGDAAIELADEGRALVFDLSGVPAGSLLVIAVPAAVLDADGVPIAPARTSFRTAASSDAEPPRIVASSPEHGARGVALDLAEIRVTFSEAMRAGRGFSSAIVNENAKQGLVFPPVGKSRWVDEKTLVWSLRERLAAATEYCLPFRDGMQDLNGNGLEALDLRFSTAPGER
ncbi:MAG TPA: Ig-like domain-containing protein [Planctomycetota bacterium]|nr:Ig-like domain-containing protein [Planctomycetota bacterium]